MELSRHPSFEAGSTTKWLLGRRPGRGARMPTRRSAHAKSWRPTGCTGSGERGSSGQLSLGSGRSRTSGRTGSQGDSAAPGSARQSAPETRWRAERAPNRGASWTVGEAQTRQRVARPVGGCAESRFTEVKRTRQWEPMPIPCPQCGAPSNTWFRTRDYNRRVTWLSFPYQRCPVCDVVFLRPVPDDLRDLLPRVVFTRCHPQFGLWLPRPNVSAANSTL